MLTEYNLGQCEQWDSIVRTFSNYDVYWLSGYVKAFQLHGDGEPLLFYYQDADVRGINVVMKRDIAKCEHFSHLAENRYFDFSTPYGYGGWLIEGEKTEKLFAAYESWCKKNSVVSEFVRFHPLIKNHVLCAESYEVVCLGETVALDLSTPETILRKMKSEARTRTRKAAKNGVKIYNGRFPEAFEVFREIYDQTMRKDHAEEYYYFKPDFYESICQDLPQNAQIFYAEKDGKVIASTIMLLTNGRMNYHLSGSLEEYSNLGATNLVIYSSALWGCANGYKTLYLGGGVGSGEDSLLRFKKTFNTCDDYQRYHIGKKIFLQEQYDELVRQRGSCSGFFPLYRAK